MCKPHKSFCIFCLFYRFIFTLGSISASDMTLGFIGVENFCRFCIQGMVYSFKPAGNILMYSGFAYSKRCSGTSNCAFLCYKIFRKLARSIIRVIKQDSHLVIVLFALTLYVRYMNLMTKQMFIKL